MSINKESLYSPIKKRVCSDPSLLIDTGLPQTTKDFLFAMRCNGFFQLRDTSWRFLPDVLDSIIRSYHGQATSFFGPGGEMETFFQAKKVGRVHLENSFSRPDVLRAIRKYRDTDEDQAARLAFLLGGIVRHLVPGVAYPCPEAVKIADSVEFTARMSLLGGRHSGDAIVSAMAIYIISGGLIDDDSHFKKNVSRMADAISEDPTIPKQTQDLGLSQALRFHAFWSKCQEKPFYRLPNTKNDLQPFQKAPTVGAEFHLPLNTHTKYRGFWQRLAILNMSQYQEGSYVQLSRNDRDVIEVRMNPSVYPLTIANWRYMTLLLPELKHAFFTSTINRDTTRDFSWDSGERALLNNLRSLGLLIYAGKFDNVPDRGTPDEINFGTAYLGQTVKVHNGDYAFTGNWGGRSKEGEYGQMGIYTGFGERLPRLAYYTSMFLHNPDILNPTSKNLLSRVRTLEDALTIKPFERKNIFRAMARNIEIDPELSRIHRAGDRIIKSLQP